MRPLAPALLAALLLATACSGSSEAVSDPTTSSSSTTQTTDTTTTTSEDTTDMTEASTPTELVLATREALFVDFDVAAAEALLAPDYIQHNPGVPTGAAPVLGLLPALGDSGLSLTTHRIFAGDLVVAHNTYENADLFGAGFCGNKVTNVWKLAAKTGDSRARAEVMAMIERCPSGALTYAVDGEAIEPDLPAAVAVIPDGPLWVSGHVEVTRADGQRLESRNRVTLCRCGQSDSKPMCDGSHKSAGFTG